MYADKSEVFNNYVNKTCDFTDGVDDSETPSSTSVDDSTEERAPSDKVKK